MGTEQLRQLLRFHGWYLTLEVRRGRGKRFAFAKRRVGKRVVTRYIKAMSRLAELTEFDVLAKIGVVTLESDKKGNSKI